MENLLRFRHDQTHLKIHGGRNHISYEEKEWGCRGRHGIVFATKNSTVVTAQTGGKAILPCTIRFLCDGTVSWVRRRDFSLLTVGTATYANDERFQSVHPFNSNDWSLQLRFVSLHDAGVYECQVTSHPPESIYIGLRVVEAHAMIDGPIEKYVKLGSAVDLCCFIYDGTETPEFMFWYHNGKMINFESDVSKVLKPNLINRRSTITIEKAGKEHSGNYTCEAANAYAASTYVHILNEEKPAAMQTSGVNAQAFRIARMFLQHFLYLLLYVM